MPEPFPVDLFLMTHYLCTYRPICASPEGRRAIENFAIPPFVDASCRREPDFQSPFPSITALCRAGKFAPRLKEGDEVVYITKKGRYGDRRDGHWRLVAVLRVVERFAAHAAAAEWYRARGVRLPSNCMVEGNPPLPFEQTGGRGKANMKQFGYAPDPARVVRAWDHSYRTRATRWGDFLVCEPTWMDLHDPPVLTSQAAADVFGGKMPGTQNPPRISPEAFARLIGMTGGEGLRRAAG